MKTLIKCIAAILMVPVLVIGLFDAIEFHTVINSDYKTPWYSGNWFESPYTNLALLGKPKTEYWTTNAIGSERWYVREVKIGDTTFWTVLQRVQNVVGKG